MLCNDIICFCIQTGEAMSKVIISMYIRQLPTLLFPPGDVPPPYFSTSSPPGWYSSLLSSLYHSSTALRCKELNNNSSDGETNENTEKEIKKEGKKSAGN